MKAYDELIIDGETIHFDEYRDMEAYLSEYLQSVFDGSNIKDEIIAFYTRYDTVAPENIDGKYLAGELLSCIDIDDWADEEGGYLVFRKDLTDENRHPKEIKFFGNITLVDYVPDEPEKSTRKGKNMKTKKSLLKPGDHRFLCLDDGESEEIEVDGVIFRIECWYDYMGDEHYTVYQKFADGVEEVEEEICDLDPYMNESEVKNEIRNNAEWDNVVRSMRKTKVKTMKKGIKKSLLTDGDHGNPWYFSGDSSGEQFFINGIEYFVEPNPYEQDGYTVFPVTQVLEDGEWETICVIREGMSVEEIEELVIDNTIRESTRKSINITNKGRDTMRNVKKNTLLKELEDIDEECEGKDCEDKKDTFRRATRKDEEPDSKKPLQEELSEDELREKCARARKRHLAMASRKGMRKADSAEPTGTIVDEVADPEELISGEEGAEPKETIVDEVESPEELDDETHGAEPEETVVDENVDPEQLDKIRRAKIRRALAKRRMQKARQSAPKYRSASVRKSPKQVRKFSVATRGSERYDGRENYNQSPMMRQAIDRAFPKEDETVKSLNARLDAIRRQSRNKVTNPIGKKRIH